jgi:hypothetical protein
MSSGGVTWVLMTNCIPMLLGFSMDGVVMSHIVGICPYALRDQVNESIFSDTLGSQHQSNTKELVPD